MEKGKQYMNIESTVKPSQCTNRAVVHHRLLLIYQKQTKGPLVLT